MPPKTTKPSKPLKSVPSLSPPHQDPKAKSRPARQVRPLYALMHVGQNATQDEIRQSYRSLIIIHHPDKNLNDPTSRDRFIKLQQAYRILSNPQKRQQYDQTGCLDTDEDVKMQDFERAYQYFRTIYKEVTKKDIDEFGLRYRGSDMEREDLNRYYDQFGGDLKSLLEHIPLSVNEDITRFIFHYQQQFRNGTLPKTGNYVKTKKHIKLLPDQSAEVEAMESSKSLVEAIRGKAASRMGFLEALEKKYCGGIKAKATSDKEAPPKERKLMGKAKRGPKDSDSDSEEQVKESIKQNRAKSKGMKVIKQKINVQPIKKKLNNKSSRSRSK